MVLLIVGNTVQVRAEILSHKIAAGTAMLMFEQK
jgi:hypothetical protein